MPEAATRRNTACPPMGPIPQTNEDQRTNNFNGNVADPNRFKPDSDQDPTFHFFV